MAYEKQNFVNGNILSAEQLNKIEDGIIAVEGQMLAPRIGTTRDTSPSAVQEALLEGRSVVIESNREFPEGTFVFNAFAVNRSARTVTASIVSIYRDVPTLFILTGDESSGTWTGASGRLSVS